MAKSDPWGNVLSYRPFIPDEKWRPFHPEKEKITGWSARSLFISQMFPNPIYDSGSFVLDQARALREAGVDARAIAPYRFWIVRNLDLGFPAALAFSPFTAANYLRTFHDARWYDVGGVPAIHIPYPLLWSYWNHADFYRRPVLKAVRNIHGLFPFDIVHAHSTFHDGAAGAAIAGKFGVPLVITEHLGEVDKLFSDDRFAGVIRSNIATASRVIAVSRAHRDKLAGFLDERDRAKLAVVPNCVDTSVFYPSTGPAPDLAAPRFAFIGYFRAVKNLELLIGAFASVLKSIPRATLTMIGSGKPSDPSCEEGLKRMVGELGIGKAVRFLPVIPANERMKMADTIRDECDIVVLTSRYESFGCVLMEALACGKQVVSTRCGGPEDIIDGDAKGFLCENGSRDDLAEKLEMAASNLAGHDPKAAAADASARFSSKRIGDMIHEIYKDALSVKIGGMGR